MQILTLSSDAPTDIALSTMSVSEVAIENLPVAPLGATGGGLNSSFTYEIVSDESGGAFAIEGDRLVIADNFRLDFETQPNVEVRIRATDINGASYEETFTIAVGDVAVETRYSAGDEFTVNTDTEGFNVPLAIAPLASGGFVVVSSWFEFGVGDGFRMQIFDSAGAPVGAEIDLDLMERGGSRMVARRPRLGRLRDRLRGRQHRSRRRLERLPDPGSEVRFGRQRGRSGPPRQHDQ